MKKIDKIFDDLHYELITEKQAKQQVLELFTGSDSLLAECLKYAVEDTRRISGDHDGNAGILYTDDNYNKIADDFINSMK